jgi:hypothetical protein
MRGEQLTEIHAGENKIKSQTRCCHASRKQLTSPPLTGGWRDAAATYAPSPFVAPEAGVGMAVYNAKATLHAQGKRSVGNAGGECSLTA